MAISVRPAILEPESTNGAPPSPAMAWPVPRAASRGMPAIRLGLLAALALVSIWSMVAGAPEWLSYGAEGGGWVLAAICVAYALLLAVPFVPAVEIGLLIMVVYGKAGAVGAYAATVAGLSLAYLLGRALRGERVCGGVGSSLAAIEDRLERVRQRVPGRAAPAVVLALLLNLPGNVAVGGGGGIALVYGACRILPWPVYLATVAVATSIVPLLVLAGMLGTETLRAGM